MKAKNEVKNIFLGKKVLMLFIIFGLIAFAGTVGSLGFSPDITGNTRAFVSVIGVAFWPLWIYLMFPLAIIAGITGTSNLVFGAPYFFYIQILYFYSLSVIIAWAWDKINTQKKV